MKKLGWRSFRIVLVLGPVSLGVLWALGFVAELELEYGYYGQFNRVKHVIEDMPGRDHR